MDIQVDSMTPRLLIYDRPATSLEGKFSMPFCAAAAIVDGHVGISTFDLARIQSPEIQALMPKVRMRANTEFDMTPPLSHTIVTLRLRDGRVLERSSSGARGYPARPASDAQLSAKFSECARRVLPAAVADEAWATLSTIEKVEQMSVLTELLSPAPSRVS
jgi:2-methylcitrate dehydratase PrpD